MATWGLKMGSWGLLGRLGGFLSRFFILELSWRRPGGVLEAFFGVFWWCWWPTWPQLGPQLGPQNEPKSKQKSINFCMLLGIGFLGTLVDFWGQKGGKLAPSWPPRSRSTSKGVFFKKPRFSNGKTMIFKVLGVEVEAKNRSKIDEKMKLSWEGFIFSIFMDFSRFWRPSWPQVGVQDRPKIDTKNSLKNGRFSRGLKMGLKNFPGFWEARVGGYRPRRTLDFRSLN